VASDAPQRLRGGFASESTPLDADPAWDGTLAAEPAAGGTPNGPAPAVQQETATGLPRRVPRANLAPGILEQRERVASDPPAGQPQRLRSPEEVRSLLATYRAGLQRGRQSAASGEAADWESATDRRPPEPGGEDDEAR
jgi:hypothetical protein